MIMGGNKKTLCAHHGRTIVLLSMGALKNLGHNWTRTLEKIKKKCRKQGKIDISFLLLFRTYEKDTRQET